MTWIVPNGNRLSHQPAHVLAQIMERMNTREGVSFRSLCVWCANKEDPYWDQSPWRSGWGHGECDRCFYIGPECFVLEVEIPAMNPSTAKGGTGDG